MKRFSVWWTLLVLIPLLVTGCANRPGGGQTARTAEMDDTFVDLPSVVLDFNAEGTVADDSAFAWLPGLDGVSLPADIVANMIEANIQHIMVDIHPMGITVLSNGQPLLGSMRYDEATLESASVALAALGDEDGGGMINTVNALLPMVHNLGMGVVARFPVKEGNRAIPLPTPRYTFLSDRALADAARERSTDLPLSVGEDGSLSSSNFLFSMVLGMVPAGVDVALPEDFVQDMGEAGITEISVQTRSLGLTVGINGNSLPLITWNRGELDNFLALAGQIDLWGEIAPNMDPGTIDTIVGTVLPVLLRTNLNIVLEFPEVAA